MIHSRITSKAQTTVPVSVRRALGIAPGDEVGWEIEEGRVVVTKIPSASERFVPDFSIFTEWADELDSAYDAL